MGVDFRQVLLNKIAALQTQLKEEHAARMSDNEAADGAAADYEAQIKALLNKLSEMERLQARTESSLESEQAQREQDVRTLSTAQEELSTVIHECLSSRKTETECGLSIRITLTHRFPGALLRNQPVVLDHVQHLQVHAVRAKFHTCFPAAESESDVTSL
eukprot:COSAG05_NODE_20_length_33177_cov_336.302639_7_plen_160_part_00